MPNAPRSLSGGRIRRAAAAPALRGGRQLMDYPLRGDRRRPGPGRPGKNAARRRLSGSGSSAPPRRQDPPAFAREAPRRVFRQAGGRPASSGPPSRISPFAFVEARPAAAGSDAEAAARAGIFDRPVSRAGAAASAKADGAEVSLAKARAGPEAADSVSDCRPCQAAFARAGRFFTQEPAVGGQGARTCARPAPCPGAGGALQAPPDPWPLLCRGRPDKPGPALQAGLKPQGEGLLKGSRLPGLLRLRPRRFSGLRPRRLPGRPMPGTGTSSVILFF
jgi:hypothetical protein